MSESYKRKRSPPARCPISVPNRSTRETSVTHSASIAEVTESLTADSESHITEASEKTCGTPLNILFEWAVRFAVVDVHTPQSQLNFGMVRCFFCQVYMRVHKQRDKLTRHEKSVLYTKSCKVSQREPILDCQSRTRMHNEQLARPSEQLVSEQKDANCA